MTEAKKTSGQPEDKKTEDKNKNPEAGKEQEKQISSADLEAVKAELEKVKSKNSELLSEVKSEREKKNAALNEASSLKKNSNPQAYYDKIEKENEDFIAQLAAKETKIQELENKFEDYKKQVVVEMKVFDKAIEQGMAKDRDYLTFFNFKEIVVDDGNQINDKSVEKEINRLKKAKPQLFTAGPDPINKNAPGLNVQIENKNQKPATRAERMQESANAAAASLKALQN